MNECTHTHTNRGVNLNAGNAFSNKIIINIKLHLAIGLRTDRVSITSEPFMHLNTSLCIIGQDFFF